MKFNYTNALNDLKYYTIEQVATKYNVKKSELVARLSKF